MSEGSTKRVAKNTIIMYIRMIVLMCISFYASRLLLKTLGVEDYGIYSVVGSISSSFVAIKSLFSESIQRFLNVAKGKSNNSLAEQIEIFNLSILAHIVLMAIFILVVEIIGMWLLYNKLSIPEGRFDAAVWVLQMTIISTAISIISIPYDAVIIANEKMGFYAIISIIDGLLKLVFVLVLPVLGFDYLKEYSTLLVLIPFSTLVIQLIYVRRFPECKFQTKYNKSLFKEIMSLSSWNFVGNICFSLIHEGINMLLNVFGGVVSNAARAIAYQVKGVTGLLSSNTMVAVRPVVMQQSVQKSNSQYFKVINLISRISFFFFFLPVIPLIVYCPQLLGLWLGEVPENAALFTRLILIGLLIRSLHEPINIMNMAFGRIKRMMYIESSLMVGCLLLVYASLSITGYIWIPFAIMSLMELFIIVALVLNANKELGFSGRLYIKEVGFPLLLLSVFSGVIGTLFLFYVQPNNVFSLIIWSITLAIIIIGLCLCFMNKTERGIVLKILKK